MAKKKPKTKITKEQLDKLEAGRIRQEKKDAGFFDGRFVTRSEESKKKYKRTKKHRNRNDYD